MKQFKILIAFIFLFTQNVFATPYGDEFGNPPESAVSGETTPKCSKTIEEVSSDLSLIQIGSEKDITKLNAAQRKASELKGVLSCLLDKSDAGKALEADVDSASTNINNQINIVYNLVVDEEKSKSKSESDSDSVREAKKFAEVKPSEQLPSKSATVQTTAATPVTVAPAAAPNAALPAASDAPAKKTDLQLSTNSTTTTTDPKVEPKVEVKTEPKAEAKVEIKTETAVPAVATTKKDDAAVVPVAPAAPAAAEKAKPTVAEQKEKVGGATSDAIAAAKKNADTAAATPVKPAASSDINIGAIAKIGLMAAAAWIYVKQITKAFKKKDEETAAGRSTASSGSGSSSSSNKDGKQSPGDYKNASYSGNIKEVPGVFGDGSWPTGDSTLLVEHPDIYGLGYGLGGTFEFSIAADGKVSGMFTLWGAPCPISGGQLPNGGTEVTVILPGSTAVIRFSGTEVSGYVYEPGPAGHGWETHKRGNLKGRRK